MSTKHVSQHLNVLLFTLLIFSATTVFAQDPAAGKTVFMSKCASCHQVLKKATGPALAGLEEPFCPITQIRPQAYCKLSSAYHRYLAFHRD